MCGKNSNSYRNLVVKLGCWPGCLLKSTPWASLPLQNSIAKRMIRSTWRPKSHSYVLQCPCTATLMHPWCSNHWIHVEILCTFVQNRVLDGTSGSVSIHPSIHPGILPSIHRSFIHPSIHSLIHSFIHSFIQTFINSFMHSFIHSFIHPLLLHAPTLCIGVPAFHYVMGGGCELCTQSVIGKRIRDNRHRGEPTNDLTLPYLTLPYLKLV